MGNWAENQWAIDVESPVFEISIGVRFSVIGLFRVRVVHTVVYAVEELAE